MAKLATLLIGVNKCGNMCPGWCVAGWCPSVFLPCAQCSWNRLSIHHHPHQDKVLNEDELMNIFENGMSEDHMS